MGNTFKRNSLLELLGQLINELSKLPQQGQEHQLRGGLWPLGNLPHMWKSGRKGLLLTNPSLFAWMCLGIKQLERCLMCAPNQK